MMGISSASRCYFIVKHEESLVAATFSHEAGWELQSFPLGAECSQGVLQVVCTLGSSVPTGILHLRMFIQVPGFSFDLPRAFPEWEAQGRVLVAELSGFPSSEEGSFWQSEVREEILRAPVGPGVSA